MNRNFQIVNCDTDSISFAKQSGNPFTDEQIKILMDEINKISPEFMLWENDGYFSRVVVLRAKNYILYDGKKIKVKGSALKSSTLEPILKQMLGEFIEALVFERQHTLPDIYEKYVAMVDNITDIKPWCTKKTLSPKTYQSERKNETDIIDAIKGTDYRSGDKVYLFVRTKEVETGDHYKVGVKKGQPKMKTLRYYSLQEHFEGDYDKNTYYGKLHKTVQRFSSVIDTSMFKKYDTGNI
jgi:hypothetical protein